MIATGRWFLKKCGVSTKALNQAARRNSARFPEDSAFLLTLEEKTEGVTNCDYLRRLKFSPVSPWAFTEHGALMAANILNSLRNKVPIRKLLVHQDVSMGFSGSTVLRFESVQKITHFGMRFAASASAVFMASALVTVRTW